MTSIFVCVLRYALFCDIIIYFASNFQRRQMKKFSALRIIENQNLDLVRRIQLQAIGIHSLPMVM